MEHIDQLAAPSIGERLGRLARLWRMVADAELAPLGLTHSRWSVLWKLYRMGQEISQKALADALEIELASLMRTLGHLEQQGLIVRHCCPHDKRVRRIALTETGFEVLEFMEERIMRVRAELYADISPEALSIFESTLNQISDNAIKKLQPNTPQGEE
jgi:MarR family transcriptional regulator for hemolysin